MRKALIFLCILGISGNVYSQDTPIIGRTTGQLPYLEYGPGDDRLGGAKMTYIDSGVLVRVVDSLGTDYIIELASSLKAFISKQSIQTIPNFQPKPYYLSGNWKTERDEQFDYLMISMPERLPYRGTMQVNPNRLIIDLFGVTSNTNWITQVGETKEIRNTWFEQVENGLLRVFIDLKSKAHFGYDIHYDSKSSRLIVRVRHAPDKQLKNLHIAVDAGHGGDNSGAAGIRSGKSEKRLTLEYALALEKELKKSGVKQVMMTRTQDISLTMPERIMMLRKAMPQILISIHFNSSSVDTVNGTSTFYRYIGFRPLTQFILQRMKGLGLNEFGNVGSFNFALSGPTEYPNCLVEVAFLSNRGDEQFILSKKSPELVAKAIKEGIKDWLKSL